MPYIKPHVRPRLDALAESAARAIESPGELNYFITRMILFVLEQPGSAVRKPLGYGEIAEITGVLENVKQEFYRRVAEPYEDRKRKENGDVY